MNFQGSGVPVKPFETFRGTATAVDGSAGIISFIQKDGAEFSVAFTPNQAMQLVDLAAFLATDCGRKSCGSPTSRLGFKAAWFEVGAATDAGHSSSL